MLISVEPQLVHHRRCTFPGTEILETRIVLLSSIHNCIEAAAATRQSYRNDNYVLSELDSAAISLRDNVWWDV